MTQKPTNKKQARSHGYHHGDLRAALLQAVAELIKEDGIEALTLREVARRAGVSHGAPARHFKHLQDLLTEFAAEAFDKLVATMDEEIAKTSTDALEGAGLGYLRFAMENPEHFRLMFQREKLDASSPRLQAARVPARLRLREALAAAYRRKNRKPIDPETLEVRVTLAWCSVHGYAVLWADEKNSNQILVEAKAMLDALRPALLMR